jgi:hypothetical protein
MHLHHFSLDPGNRKIVCYLLNNDAAKLQRTKIKVEWILNDHPWHQGSRAPPAFFDASTIFQGPDLLSANDD